MEQKQYIFGSLKENYLFLYIFIIIHYNIYHIQSIEIWPEGMVNSFRWNKVHDARLSKNMVCHIKENKNDLNLYKSQMIKFSMRRTAQASYSGHVCLKHF